MGLIIKLINWDNNKISWDTINSINSIYLQFLINYIYTLYTISQITKGNLCDDYEVRVLTNSRVCQL